MKRPRPSLSKRLRLALMLGAMAFLLVSLWQMEGRPLPTAQGVLHRMEERMLYEKSELSMIFSAGPGDRALAAGLTDSRIHIAELKKRGLLWQEPRDAYAQVLVNLPLEEPMTATVFPWYVTDPGDPEGEAFPAALAYCPDYPSAGGKAVLALPTASGNHTFFYNGYPVWQREGLYLFLFKEGFAKGQNGVVAQYGYLLSGLRGHRAFHREVKLHVALSGEDGALLAETEVIYPSTWLR